MSDFTPDVEFLMDCVSDFVGVFGRTGDLLVRVQILLISGIVISG